jgi:NADPH-dependent 2,4-dienoyl-CoA reductase/sulfur reductase-like enzyme/rhodanese-related sulfurtransferase
MRVVIIGGVAGGMSAATRLRRLDETAEIIVIERSEYVSYANCGLPYYVGGIIDDREALMLQTPEKLWDRFRIQVRTGTEVTAIDRAAHTVTVAAAGTTTRTSSATGTPEPGTEAIAYDRLILSMGARPSIPTGVTGIEHTHSLRTVADADALYALATSGGHSKAVIIGAGFIGVELAENFVLRGLETHLVQRAATVLPGFDPEMIAGFQNALVAHGVELHLGTTAATITDNTVTLVDGTVLTDAFTILATGVTPDSHLAADAGLAVTATGHILVDDQMRTNDPAIFAVGDATSKVTAYGQRAIPLANLANRHGRLVADVIAGRDTHAAVASGTATISAFGMVAAMTGMSEQALSAIGVTPHIIHLHPGSHAGYYPGAATIALKVLFSKETGAILGAQGVGADGADKRIDVIATAMAGGLTADQLMDLELAYSPQVGSAKDPINMAGYIADNILTGTTRTIQWHELSAAREAGATLIDVRTAGEFANGAIPGAVNVDLNELRTRINELPAGELIVHCQVGQRGHTASRLLTELGRSVKNLDGGWLTWRAGTGI